MWLECLVVLESEDGDVVGLCGWVVAVWNAYMVWGDVAMKGQKNPAAAGGGLPSFSFYKS